MKQKSLMTKAELARQLGVSRAYITMIANGKRKPSEDIVNKLNSLSFETNQIVNKTEANLLTLNQQVQGSSPWRLTTKLAEATDFQKNACNLTQSRRLSSYRLAKYYLIGCSLKNCHITSLASKSLDVLPIIDSGRYCSPPGQV